MRQAAGLGSQENCLGWGRCLPALHLAGKGNTPALLLQRRRVSRVHMASVPACVPGSPVGDLLSGGSSCAKWGVFSKALFNATWGKVMVWSPAELGFNFFIIF